MFSEGFEPANPAIELPQTLNFELTTTGIGKKYILCCYHSTRDCADMCARVCAETLHALSVKWNCTRSKMAYLRHHILTNIEIRSKHTQ
jgi:hypothetical protein